MTKLQKYKVIGWVKYDSNYPTINCVVSGSYRAMELAVIEEIRKYGYSFGGTAHHFKSGCVPLLNNGEAFRVSQREWGSVMAEAYNIKFDNGMEYVVFFIDDYIKRYGYKYVYPKPFVDKGKILPKGTKFCI